MATKRKVSEKTKSETSPPENNPEVINWAKATRSFNRLLKTRGEDMKKLSDPKNYEDYDF